MPMFLKSVWQLNQVIAKRLLLRPNACLRTTFYIYIYKIIYIYKKNGGNKRTCHTIKKNLLQTCLDTNKASKRSQLRSFFQAGCGVAFVSAKGFPTPVGVWRGGQPPRVGKDVPAHTPLKGNGHHCDISCVPPTNKICLFCLNHCLKQTETKTLYLQQ